MHVLIFMLTDLSIRDIPITDIPGFFPKEIQVDVLRLDTVHPVVSGNKWFKLRFYLEQAIAQNKKTIITFGGAWSNHIVATAAICQMNGLKAQGIIRGEEPAALSPTLRQAKDWGMELVFISRSEYREKTVPLFLQDDSFYVIPEGGYGEAGAEGAATILEYCSKNYTHYCCAVGTGTMMAGLTRAATPDQQVIGIAVLKNNADLNDRVAALSGNSAWQLLHDYHGGGYARHTPALLAFMNEFYRQTGIPSDFVYTGKLFFAIHDLAGQDFFPPGSKLLLVHSGGLQGNASLEKGTLIF